MSMRCPALQMTFDIDVPGINYSFSKTILFKVEIMSTYPHMQQTQKSQQINTLRVKSMNLRSYGMLNDVYDMISYSDALESISMAAALFPSLIKILASIIKVSSFLEMFRASRRDCLALSLFLR